MTTVSFPGIGIGEFTMNEIALAFNLFGLAVEIRWYGILITLGILLAIVYALFRSKHEGIIVDDLLDIGIFAIIAGIIGARLYYVLTYGVGNFIDTTSGTLWLRIYNSFVNIIAVWSGGIAIYGAVIGGALAVYLVCRRKKINFLKAFDAIAPGVMIGQIIGRWGNFVNGEAYGGAVREDSFLYFMRMGLVPNMDSYTRMYYYHPTFLYESLWNLLGFIIINALYKKKKFDGQVFLMYVTWYGFGRMFIEGLRTDSLYVGVFRISQVVGFCCFTVGSALIFMGMRNAKKRRLEHSDYVPVYPKLVKRSTPDADIPDGRENTENIEAAEQDAGAGQTEQSTGAPEAGNAGEDRENGDNN